MKKLTTQNAFKVLLSTFLAFVVFQLVIVIIITLGSSIDPVSGKAVLPAWSEGLGFTYATNALIQGLIFLCAFAYYKRNFGGDVFKEARLKKGLNAKQVLLLAGVSVVAIIAFVPLAELFMTAVVALGFKITAENDYSSVHPALMFFLNFVCICILPAFCEEFLFRGAFTNMAKEKSFVFSIVWSGIAFGLFHLNAQQLVHQLFLGMVCAYVYFASGSFWAGAIIHFTNNLIALLLAFIPTFGDDAMLGGQMAGYVIGLLAISAVGVYFLLVVLRVFTAVCKKKNLGESYVPEAGNAFSLTIRDIGRAFTASGIKENKASMNATLKQLFESDGLPAAGTMLSGNLLGGDGLALTEQAEDEYTVAERTRKDRNAVMTTIIIMGVMWLAFFLIGFIQK